MYLHCQSLCIDSIIAHRTVNLDHITRRAWLPAHQRHRIALLSRSKAEIPPRERKPMNVSAVIIQRLFRLLVHTIMPTRLHQPHVAPHTSLWLYILQAYDTCEAKFVVSRPCCLEHIHLGCSHPTGNTFNLRQRLQRLKAHMPRTPNRPGHA